MCYLSYLVTSCGSEIFSLEKYVQHWKLIVLYLDLYGWGKIPDFPNFGLGDWFIWDWNIWHTILNKQDKNHESAKSFLTHPYILNSMFMRNKPCV